MSTYLRKLRKDKIIDDATFYKILPGGSSPGVLYGLPKVHKTGCPFRPIVSSVNTYNYNLASYLVSILQPISTNQYTVKDSFSFADWAKKYKHTNGIMCSLDVSSLFTNVPLEETLNICIDKYCILLLILRLYQELFYASYWNFPPRRATFFLMVNTMTKSMVLPWVRHWALS